MNVFIAQTEVAVEEEDLLVFRSIDAGESRNIERDQDGISLTAQNENEATIVPGGMVDFAINELGATLVCVEDYLVEE